jgi:hypothetical protein
VKGAAQEKEIEHARIVLGLLESVERNGTQSQRHLAAELGIALGLVNAYLRRCVSKGLLKVAKVPARRYAYYVTPRGFAEKSRLTVKYLSYSFSFFRSAKSDCAAVLAAAEALGCERVVLAGVSEVAEIAIICAIEGNVEIVALVDRSSPLVQFVGRPVLKGFDKAPSFDGIIVTDINAPHETYASAVAQFGSERVLVPKLLGVPMANAERRQPRE